MFEKKKKMLLILIKHTEIYKIIKKEQQWKQQNLCNRLKIVTPASQYERGRKTFNLWKDLVLSFKILQLVIAGFQLKLEKVRNKNMSVVIY